MLVTREITNAELADLLEQLPRVGLPQAGIVAEAVKRLRAAALASQGAATCTGCGETSPNCACVGASETAAGAVTEAVRTALKNLYLAGWNDAMDNSNDVHAQAKAVHDTILAIATPPAATQVPIVTRDEAIRVAKEIGLIGWISDDGAHFEWVETQKPSLQLVAFAERFAARTQSAPPAAQQIGGVVLDKQGREAQ